MIKKDFQYYKFCAYGFLKNMRFFDPFILLFFYDRGCSYLQIGFLFSIREISSTLLEVPSGVVADFTGRKNSMIFSFIAYILSFLIFSFAEQYWLFAIAMFLFAVGESFRSGTHKAMIVDYLKLHNMLHLKTEYYGSTRAWSQFGSAISSLIAGALVFFTGEYRIIFIASIFPYLLDLINLASYPKILNGTLTKKQSHTNTRTAFKSLISSPNLIHGLANSAVYDGIFKTIKDYLQPILKSFAIGLPFLLMVNQDQRSAFIVAIVYFILFLLSAFASKNAYKIKTFLQKVPKP